MVISGRESVGETRNEDISRVNNLVIDLEGLYSDIDRISSRFGLTDQLQTPFRTTKLRTEPGDGVFLESMDSRVLPFDMRSTGATVWQFLAEESGGQARFYYQNVSLVGFIAGLLLTCYRANCLSHVDIVSTCSAPT